MRYTSTDVAVNGVNNNKEGQDTVMKYDFLRSFPKRMKSVGLYAVLISGVSQKAIWKQTGFESLSEQLNLVFSILLYIMEQSLKEANCTIDDISVFIDELNSRFYHRYLSFDECRELGSFIINTVLSNEGQTMSFNGFDYETSSFEAIPISYVANRIVYTDQDIRRTSYYLTDDGYSLLLGTLEVENNMKLTIQEMIFRLHLEKQSYDKALDDIKNVFNLMRIQLQKIREAMTRIRRNALEYSVADYAKLLQEDLDTIDQTREKFRAYRENVRVRVKELEEGNIDVNSVTGEEAEKLRNLKEIERYLSRAIDEHQKILDRHFDLKSLYTQELEKITEMSMIRRFSLRTELYEKVLEDPGRLDRLDSFLRPLFNRDPGKIFNLNRILEVQKLRTVEEEEGTEETEDFDEEAWQEEQSRLRSEKLKKYEKSLTMIVKSAVCGGRTSLSAIKASLSSDEERDCLIPTVQIFKEIMVELIRAEHIDFEALKTERASFLQDEAAEFRLTDMLLKILERHSEWPDIRYLEIFRTKGADSVVFENVSDESGRRRSIRCSDVRILAGKE